MNVASAPHSTVDRWHDFLHRVPGKRVSEGNRVVHLRDEDRAVDAIWEHIASAQERIWVSMYMLVPDKVGLGTLERLTAAARRGVDVLLLYDYTGSLHLRDRHLTPLREAGGEVAVFNRPWPPWKRTGSLGIRNHRKLILVDDRAAVCGGMNLSEAFAGNEHGSCIFDDTVLLVEGPCIYDLADIFLQTWEEETGERPRTPPRPPPLPDGLRVEVLETDPRGADHEMQGVLEAAIERAEQRVRLVTPYFVPAPWLTDALLAAAARGADVQVMTAGRCDVPIARAAGHACYGPLLRGGVRVFELFGRMLHSKTVSIDGCFGAVGSYNMDVWTSRHDLDLTLAFLDERLAVSLEEEFEAFKRNASAYTLRDHEKRHLPTRTLHWLSLQLARRL